MYVRRGLVHMQDGGNDAVAVLFIEPAHCCFFPVLQAGGVIGSRHPWIFRAEIGWAGGKQHFHAKYGILPDPLRPDGLLDGGNIVHPRSTDKMLIGCCSCGIGIGRFALTLIVLSRPGNVTPRL